MARRKNAPESIRVKHGLSERLRSLRTEFYGDRGGPDLARTLGIPVRTWYNYENGVTVPAEIILRIVELTQVEPVWLLRGEGPKFREAKPGSPAGGSNGHSDGLAGTSVATLLRTALERLEQKERIATGFGLGVPIVARRDDEGAAPDDLDMILVDGEGRGHVPLTPADGPRYDAARGEWLEARRACRHLRVSDDSMAPIVAEGPTSPTPRPSRSPRRSTTSWSSPGSTARPIVRWFQHCGRFALLRAENPTANPPSILVEFDRDRSMESFHRVLWISTPHQ